jgi:hypothetical protein
VVNPPALFFFLVAGYEYSHKGLDFFKMCTGRVRERIAFINRTHKGNDPLVDKDTTLRFIRFQIGTGQIEVIDKQFVVGRGVRDPFPKERDWKPLSSVGTGDRFDPNTFVTKGPFRAINRTTDYKNLHDEYPDFNQSAATSNIMSIVDVYRSVRAAPLGSVRELSFFSHGWIGGPVLVNSSDEVNNPDLRDPQDKDGRARLDFSMASMGGSNDLSAKLNLAQFMLSFHPKGIMQTWGCNFDIELRVIQQAQKRIRRGGVTDNTVIDFHFEDWAPDRYEVVDPSFTFFPRDKTQTDISRKFGEVKKFLRKRLGFSYAFQFATHSGGTTTPGALGGKTALGAIPGTEGDDEKSGFRMTKVCAKVDEPECPVGFANLFVFYETHFGVKVDDRGYGIFDQATVQKLAADIATDVP